MNWGSEQFYVDIQSDSLRFSGAHFIAYKGYREKLHGHNYTVSAKLVGHLCNDGYVMDFTEIKQVLRSLCKEHNEQFICPTFSDVLRILISSDQVDITTEDNSRFSFPKSDCWLVPLVHSSSEELAKHLCAEFIHRVGMQKLTSRGIETVEMSVAEAPTQKATFVCPLQTTH